MPDISLCKNEDCPLRENCYRYTATPGEFMQSYASFEWGITIDNDIYCDYFIDNKLKSQ
jgi:hypothetical protein